MKDKKISFIIVNYNYLKDIQGLISSIQKSMLQAPYEIIIIDNASTDGSKEYFATLSKNIEYIYLTHNIGYGAANNVGVEKSKGEILVLINPDTLIKSPDFSEFIYKVLDNKTGVLAPKVIYQDGQVQPNCGSYATLKTYIMQSFKLGFLARKLKLIPMMKRLVKYMPFLQTSFIGVYLANFSQEINKKECHWVSGACMIILKNVFLEVGGFDENFFLYCEDEDLCKRITLLEYKIFIDTSSTIVHNEGFIKSRKSRELTAALKHRYESNIYYLEKYSGRLSANILRVFYIFQNILSGFIYLGVSFKVAKSYFKFVPILFGKIGK